MFQSDYATLLGSERAATVSGSVKLPTAEENRFLTGAARLRPALGMALTKD